MAQFLATAIFIIMFLLIISEKLERHIVTLLCGAATLVFVFGVAMHSFDAIFSTLNIASIITPDFWYQCEEASETTSGINWATILFIAGMMIMVEGMEKAGFFRWLCLQIAKTVHYKAGLIFLTFMIMAGVLSMFIDSITVILFLAAVTVELAHLLKFDPVPMILSEIFCANLGGAATMCGDPPNIIIGTSLGYSFADFITHTGAMAGISLVVSIIYFVVIFKKNFKSNEKEKMTSYPNPKDAIKSPFHFAISSAIFGIAVVLLVTHAMTGLTVATIGVVIAGLTLITWGKSAFEIMRKLDYKTLLFFIGLFIVVGGLEQTGILEIIAGFISSISGGNVKLMIAIIIWGSAIASAFIDNIPFAATMIPVIKSLAAAQSVNLSVLAWALSMGTDIGGSATPIGASANVVGTSVAAKAGHPIGWGKYCRVMAPITILVVLISMLYIFVLYL